MEARLGGRSHLMRVADRMVHRDSGIAVYLFCTRGPVEEPHGRGKAGSGNAC